jgi:pyruvate/2-oxoglutarate dehydrogenase complex dihydrolipoamide acyltransferase (E2) component
MSDKVTMTALDTIHLSNVQSDNLHEGDVFVVNEPAAKILEERGLASRGGSSAKAVNPSSDKMAARPETREEIDAERGAKAEKAAPENKAEAAAPANKTIARKAK